MARYYEQLREASGVLGTDIHGCGRRPSLGCSSPRVEASSFEQKNILKRSKFSFSDADMWCAMIKGYTEGGDSWKALSDVSANRWQEAKRHNQALKTARVDEEWVHAQLHKNVAEAYEEAREAANMCSRQLDLLQSQQEEGSELGHRAGEGEDLDLCPPWAHGPHGEAAEEAARGTDELQRVVSLHQQELDKRAHMVDELKRLEMDLEQAKLQTNESQIQHKKVLDGASQLEQVSVAQRELGFPDITFHDACQLGDDASKSTVVLSGAAGGSVDEALRSVTVEFAKSGRLIRAVPHLTHGLEREAAEAVKHDDLPSLLTMVWHRICDGKRLKPSCGGA